MKYLCVIIAFFISIDCLAQTGSIRCKVIGTDSVRIKHGVAWLYEIDTVQKEEVGDKYLYSYPPRSKALQKAIVNKKGIAEFRNVLTDRLYTVVVERHNYDIAHTERYKYGMGKKQVYM